MLLWMATALAGPVLEAPDHALVGEPLVVTITDATPGVDVQLWVDERRGQAPCHPVQTHRCLDLTRQARLLGTGRSGNSGTARITFTPTGPGNVYLQAIAAPTNTPFVRLRILQPGGDDDGDGIVNADELARGLDPRKADTDADGLSDLQELDAGTDPTRPDSDGDGVFDLVELALGMDPWSDNTDGDRYGDAVDSYPNTPDPRDPFERDDIPVSAPDADIYDPEFDPLTHRLAWQDRDGLEVWSADFDPCTGLVYPPDFEGHLVDRDVVTIGEATNGPEWMYTDRGSELVYAKRFDGEPRIVRAWSEGAGWRTELVPGAYGTGPFGTLIPGDTNAKIRYRGGPDQEDGWWVELGTGVVDTYGRLWRPSRWAWDRSGDLLARVRADGAYQLAQFDTQTGSWSKLTDSAIDKGYIFRWHAPELGESLILSTHLDGVDNAVAIYRDADGDGRWELYKRIPAPPGHPFVISAEPFVSNGRSYVSYLASRGTTNNANGISQAWIASADPSDRFVRRVDDLPGDVVIKDPEPVVTSCGTWIYYTHLTQTVRVIRRAATGL